jgi:hypothetical protein
MRHLLTLEDWTPAQIAEAIALARTVKANPARYADVLRRKTLCMIFEKPSLRTRLSFEAGMNQLGGHAIYYDTSPRPSAPARNTSPTPTAPCAACGRHHGAALSARRPLEMAAIPPCRSSTP